MPMPSLNPISSRRQLRPVYSPGSTAERCPATRWRKTADYLALKYYPYLPAEPAGPLWYCRAYYNKRFLYAAQQAIEVQEQVDLPAPLPQDGSSRFT